MIKLILLDVDGTMTDGGIYIDGIGGGFKKFNVKDGYSIVHAQNLGIDFGIITGKKSNIVKLRAEELNMKYLYQGISDKAEVLEKILIKSKLDKSQIAYMGDDLNDFHIMKRVGLSGAPGDAAQEICDIADFVSNKKGGEGAVREFVEYILKKDGKWKQFLENVK